MSTLEQLTSKPVGPVANDQGKENEKGIPVTSPCNRQISEWNQSGPKKYMVTARAAAWMALLFGVSRILIVLFSNYHTAVLVENSADVYLYQRPTTKFLVSMVKPFVFFQAKHQWNRRPDFTGLRFEYYLGRHVREFGCWFCDFCSCYSSRCLSRFMGALRLRLAYPSRKRWALDLEGCFSLARSYQCLQRSAARVSIHRNSPLRSDFCQDLRADRSDRHCFRQLVLSVGTA